MKHIESNEWPPRHTQETCCEKHLREYREQLLERLKYYCENAPGLYHDLKNIVYRA